MVDCTLVNETTRFREGYERLQKTWKGKADRVPITSQMNELALSRSGKPSRVFFQSGRVLVDGLVETALDFHLDVPSISYDVYNIELEALGHPIVFPELSTPVADIILLDDQLPRIDVGDIILN